MKTVQLLGRQMIVGQPWLLQLGKFMTIGVLNTLVDLSVFFLLTHFTTLASYPVTAKALSYSCGILNSFLWNRAWTFRAKTAFIPGLALFLLVNLGALLLNAGMMYAGLVILQVPRLVALGLATLSSFLLSFVVSKFLVFRS